MRRPSLSRFLGPLVAGLASLAVAASSEAAPTAFRNAQLTIQVGITFGSGAGVTLLPPIAIPPGPALASGTADAVFTTGGGLFGATLPAGVFDGNGLAITVPTGPINGFQPFFANGAANFTAMGGGGFGGTMPLLGMLRVCLFDDCSGSPAVNLSVPFDVAGQGGAAYSTFFLNMTVQGSPWTTGMATVPTQAGGYLTTTGGLTATAGGGAHVQLVTPIYVSTNLSTSPIVPVIGLLQFDLVPEPASLLLLGSGVVGLASAGWRRKR